ADHAGAGRHVRRRGLVIRPSMPQSAVRFPVRRRPFHERHGRDRHALGAGPEPVSWEFFSMVMPIYDDNPFKLPHRPLMTWGLIVVNFLFFGVEISSDN